MKRIFLPLLCFFTIGISQYNKPLQQLGKDFFEWRTISQPITGDDIPRVERPDGWIPDYAPAAVQRYRKKYQFFRSALVGLPRKGWTTHDSIDYLLLRSAVERVNWELNILRLPERHPEFYVQQTVGALFDLLIIGSPWTQNRADNFMARVRSIPKTIDDAKNNLIEPVKSFGQIAVDELDGIREKLHRVAAALKNEYPNLWDPSFTRAIDSSSTALEQYRRWIRQNIPSMADSISIGRENYLYFLHYIALTPYSPEELITMGDDEWARSVAFETMESAKNINIPPQKLFPSSTVQIEQEKNEEKSVRKFVAENNIMTVPAWTQHYILRKLPDYVEPLQDFGEADDFTSPSRMNEDGIRYIPEPSNDLSFFPRSAASDPRPLMVHEGMPGHYFQLVQSWHNPDPIRRHYFDSNSNEGIGFYLEEMMLQFGLFDDSPHSREIIYRFMRLRALRVTADVNLSLGNFTIEDAARYLSETVPLDSISAQGEAEFFASTPGQAIAYQTGKIQILHLIADAKITFGKSFNIKNYHDYMMLNGNVPIALQRWEYTGKTDEAMTLWN